MQLWYDHYALSGQRSRTLMVERPFFGEVLYYFRHNFGDHVALLARVDIFCDVKLSGGGSPYIPAHPSEATKVHCVVNIEDVQHMVGFIPSNFSNRWYVVWPYMLPLRRPKKAEGVDKVVIGDPTKLP